MGFLKKLFGSRKKEERKVDEEVIEKPIENKEEVNEELTQPRNFKYLDDLIHDGVKEIVLDSDIVLGNGEESEYEEGIKLDVDDLVIDGNRHSIDAQGITRIFYSNAKNIILKNITLKNGAIQDSGGAIYNDGGTLSVFGCTLVGNTAEMHGGAIYNEGGTLSVSDSTLQGNNRGAICNNKGNLNISGSTLSKNTGEVYGGAITNNCHGELTVSDSTLIENTAISGGAIHNDYASVLSVRGCTLERNAAEVNGGAIHNDHGGKLTVSSSTFAGNTAEKLGGVICNNFGGELSVYGSTLTESTAISGGAIYNSKAMLTVSGSTFTANTVEEDGGAIYNEEGNFKVFGCVFSNNKSPITIIENRDLLQIFNSDFISNHAHNVIVNNGDLTTLSISEGKFKDNDIIESLIYNDGKSCTVEKTIFEKHPSNTIINKSNLTLIGPIIKDEGKKILNEKYLLLRRSSDELENNIHGGGIVENEDEFKFKPFDFEYLDKKIHESKTKEIILEEDISFENYENDYYEGGIELDMDNLIIDGNGHTIDAQEKTRIFYCTGKNITIKNLTLKNGHSHKNYDNPYNDHGGAIKINHKVNLTIKNCKFINNTSENSGGAIYNGDDVLTVYACTLEGNEAVSGGAICNSEGTLTVSDCTLQGNEAVSGGAIYNSGESTVSGSTLQGNTVEWHGGAINNGYGGVFSVCDCTLGGNEANVYGGAIHNGSDGTLTVSDCTFQGNTANVGGAIDSRRGTVSVSGSTFTENIAKMGAAGAISHSYGGELTVSDCTFQGNTPRDGRAIYYDIFSKYESNNCTFKDNNPDDIHEEKG